MAGNKQKSLTKIDNNYELNLRYPDINDFLKDTMYSLQDSQTYGRTLLVNPRLQVGSVKTLQNVVVAGYSVKVLLSDLIIYGFSPDQELFYDFVVSTEIFGVSLGEFTASRTTEDTRLQSVQSFSIDKPETVANFSITFSSAKVANLLTQLFTTHAEELKTELELYDDYSLLGYVLQNLFSLSFNFLCSYRLSSTGEYENGFRVPVALSYLRPSVLNQEAVGLTKIEVPAYQPGRPPGLSSPMGRDSVKAPQLIFKGVYNLTGELQLTQVSGSVTYLDSEKISVTQGTTQSQFVSNLRVRDYVWQTISGVTNTPPLVTYNYTFAVKNSTKKYAGIFATFQSPAITTGSFTLKASNYAVQLKNYKESGTNADKYAVSVSFDLTNSNSKQTALSTLFRNYSRGGAKVTDAPNLFLKVELLNSADKTNVFSPNATYDRSLFLTTLDPLSTYTTNESRQPTLSGCFLFTSANTDADRSQFSKTIQRVTSTYSGLPNFSSARLGLITPKVDLTVSTINPKGLLAVTLQWPSLNAAELAGLHQLTAASGVSVSLLDSFMNVLAVTDSVYPTNNKLTRVESPLVNPSFVYCAQIPYTKVLLDTSYKNPISTLLPSPQRSLTPILRVLSGPSLAISRLVDYVTPDFNLRDNIYCIAQWVGKSLNGQTTVMSWSSTLHRPTEAEISITGTQISMNISQKMSVARALLGRFVTRLPEVYYIYVLLPWTTVRDVGTTNSIIRTSLVSGKYNYAYALKV